MCATVHSSLGVTRHHPGGGEGQGRGEGRQGQGQASPGTLPPGVLSSPWPARLVPPCPDWESWWPGIT